MADLPVFTNPTVDAVWSALARDANRHDLHPRLSASSLGGECDRKIWDDFRWVNPPEQFDGKKLSIFATGNVWEDRIVAMLQAAGIEVDANDPETGEQFRVVFAAGHASGRTDGKARNVPEAPKTEHVLEVKSHNDRSFKDLRKKGVREAKPAHYSQMQIYLHHQHLTRALYVSVNKNDDDLYVERIEYDPAEAMRLVARAERLVTTDMRPVCSCPTYAVKGGWGCAVEPVLPKRSCRTCLHATAHLDGDARWSCDRHKHDLTIEQQQTGCPNHLFLPDLVPGEQVDVSEEGEWVEYKMADGSVWRDGCS